MARLAALLGLFAAHASVASCTLASAIDACDRRGAAERDLNGRTEGDQTLSSRNAVAAMPSGGAMAVWTSSLDATSEARGALLSPDGALLPTCDSDAEHTFSLPAHRADQVVLAAPRAEDELGVIVYRRREGSSHSLWAVPITPSGCTLPVGPGPFELRAAPSPTQILNPSVATLGEGTFVVTWTEASTTSPRPHLYAARFALAGVGRDPEILSTPLGPSGELADAVTRDGLHANGTLVPMADGAALAYFEVDTATYRVWLARFAPDLSTRFAPVLIDESPVPSGLVPTGVSIALAFESDVFFVTWMAGDERLEPVVEGRFLDGNGRYLSSPRAPDGTAFRLGSVAEAVEAEISLIGTGDGGFLVAWQESGTLAHADRSGRGLRAVAFEGDGSVRFANRACDATDFALNLAFAEDQTLPALARLPGGSTLALWVTNGGETSDRSGTGLRAVGLADRDLFPIR